MVSSLMRPRVCSQARVRSHCRVRKRGTEYVRESGMKWMSGGGATRRCDRHLGLPLRDALAHPITLACAPAHTRRLSGFPGCGSGSSFVRATGTSRAQVWVDRKVMINGYGILREIQDVEAVVISTPSVRERVRERVSERVPGADPLPPAPRRAASAKGAYAPHPDALATATWNSPRREHNARRTEKDFFCCSTMSSQEPWTRGRHAPACGSFSSGLC